MPSKPNKATAKTPKCLCCQNPAATRGNCLRCYRQFIRKCEAAGDKASEIEAKAIEAGLILPAYGATDGFNKKFAALTTSN